MNQPTLTTLTSTIHNNPCGINLLEYLCQRFPYKNQEQWIDAITSGQVVVNDSITKPTQHLKVRDRVSYTSHREEPKVATDVTVIFEDEHLLVVNKPAPLPVHAHGAFIIHTLIHLMRTRTGNFELSLGHRLDRETTGVLVLAKQKNLTTKLMAEFEKSNNQKWYLAIARGQVDFQEKLIHGWMGPKPTSQINMRQELLCEPKQGYRESSTRFFLQKPLRGYSLLACELLSGRTNQIRVHAEAAGFPLAGDKLYGRQDNEYLDYLCHLEKRGDLGGGGNWEHPRQLLHAWKLQLLHPVTRELMQWEAPVPNDMKKFIEAHAIE